MEYQGPTAGSLGQGPPTSGHRLLDEPAMATARGLPYGRCFAADTHFRGDPEHHAPWRKMYKTHKKKLDAFESFEHCTPS